MIRNREMDKLEKTFLNGTLEKKDQRNMYWKQGSVVFVDLGEGIDSEQNGIRPCVIIQNDIGNKYSSTTIVAPITKDIRLNKKGQVMPTHYIIEDFQGVGLNMVSTVLCEQIRTISKNRILGYKPIGYIEICKLKRQINASFGFWMN